MVVGAMQRSAAASPRTITADFNKQRREARPLWGVSGEGPFLRDVSQGGLTVLGFGESQKLGRALGLILGRPRSSLLQKVSFHPPTPH